MSNSRIERFFMNDKAVRNIMAFVFCITFCIILIFVVVSSKPSIDQLTELIVPLVTAFIGYLAGMASRRGGET